MFDDVAGVTAAHVRQDRLDHRHGAEHVDRELGPDLIEARLLDRALEAVAGIVDQHVDPAGLAQRVLDALAHARFVRDVEQDAEGSPWGELLELGPARFVPERASDLVAALQSGFGQGPPQAAAHTGDQPSGHRMLRGRIQSLRFVGAARPAAQ
jgi:hypothetical protein